MSREIVVVSAVRTAIGTFGGALKDVAPSGHPRSEIHHARQALILGTFDFRAVFIDVVGRQVYSIGGMHVSIVSRLLGRVGLDGSGVIGCCC